MNSMGAYSTTEPLLRLQGQRPAAGETFLETVPVGDLFLADLPAEEHFLAVPQGGKVDEPAVEILDQNAEFLEASDAPSQRSGLTIRACFEPGQPARVERPSVTRDAPAKLRSLCLALQQRTTMRDELLGQRPHRGERLVRLLNREVALCNESMIEGE
jgi:hypothetical protein